MIFRCRQLDVPGSDRDAETADSAHAPSVYADAHVDVPVGAMTFVEVFLDDTWTCWDVERIEDWFGVRVYRTVCTTAEEARAEMARWAERAS